MLVEFRDREFVKSTIVITHDLSILYQIADTILVMYAGKLVEKASAAEITAGSAASVHEAPARVAARGRGALRRERRLSGHPGPAAVAPQPADRMSLPGPLPPGVRASAPRSRRSSRSSRAASPPAGRWPPDARARRRHEGLQDGHVRKVETVTAVSDVSFVVRAGRGRLPDRRERQRQDDRRPDDPAPDRGHGRRDHVRRSRRARGSAGASSVTTTRTCRGSSRTRSARTTPSTRSTASSA